MQIDGLINNYYEKLVLDEISKQQQHVQFEQELWIDVACVALNHLPARYYRYSVDMAFYLSSEEEAQMQDRVTLAVQKAIGVVRDSKNLDNR